MNLKTAKKLRRLAESMTVGMPGGGYFIHAGRELRVHPKTTRGAYRKLKRMERR